MQAGLLVGPQAPAATQPHQAAQPMEVAAAQFDVAIAHAMADMKAAVEAPAFVACQPSVPMVAACTVAGLGKPDDDEPQAEASLAESETVPTVNRQRPPESAPPYVEAFVPPSTVVSGPDEPTPRHSSARGPAGPEAPDAAASGMALAFDTATSAPSVLGTTRTSPDPERAAIVRGVPRPAGAMPLARPARAEHSSLNNRTGRWSRDRLTQSCRRRSASTSFLAVVSKTWMAGLRLPSRGGYRPRNTRRSYPTTRFPGIRCRCSHKQNTLRRRPPQRLPERSKLALVHGPHRPPSPNPARATRACSRPGRSRPSNGRLSLPRLRLRSTLPKRASH
jgi:hypothetical protein